MLPNTPTSSTTLSEKGIMSQRINRILQITWKSWENAMIYERGLAKTIQENKGEAIPRKKVMDRIISPTKRMKRYADRMERQQG